MPHRRPVARAAEAVPLVVVLAVVFSGCGPDPVEPDAVDAERLAAIERAMPVDGAQDASAARAATGSANVVAYRASTTTTLPLGDVASPEDGAAVHAAGSALLATLREEGWTPAMVECEAAGADGAVSAAAVVATRTLDGFTAAARVDVTAEDATTSVYAPFHTEPADPWSVDPWNLAPVTGTTCLDADAPAGPGRAGEVPENLALGDVLP